MRNNGKQIITFDPTTDIDHSLVENRSDKRSHGCLMVVPQLSNGFWNNIIKSISQSDLYDPIHESEFGIEKEPHVTILYGFLPSIREDVIIRHAKSIQGPIHMWVSNVSLFNTQDYDVLKFDVFSKQLMDLNHAFKVFPNENKYNKYRPHMTIAYTKKGQGQKYAKAIFQKEVPFECTSNKLIYSGASGSYTRITL